jgi:hypothetical protein
VYGHGFLLCISCFDFSELLISVGWYLQTVQKFLALTSGYFFCHVFFLHSFWDSNLSKY